jgi:hypothetical protein
LVVLGVGLTVLLAFLSSQHQPPSSSTQALIALLAIAAQLGAPGAFGGDGKADPGLAERSAARLVSLAHKADTAKVMAEQCQESKMSPAELRQAMNQLSVHLSYLEDGYVNAIEDWRIFHPLAVDKAERIQYDPDR